MPNIYTLQISGINTHHLPDIKAIPVETLNGRPVPRNESGQQLMFPTTQYAIYYYNKNAQIFDPDTARTIIEYLNKNDARPVCHLYPNGYVRFVNGYDTGTYRAALSNDDYKDLCNRRTRIREIRRDFANRTK